MDDAQTDAPKLVTLTRGEWVAAADALDMVGLHERAGKIRAALASPRALESHAGDPFESPAHAVARLSDEVSSPSPDWRDSEAVKQLREAQECEMGPADADETTPIFMFTPETLDALLDAVQSHARPSKGE